MQFLIAGAWPYQVSIAAEPIIDSGRELMGRFDERGRLILISPACPPQRRLWVLMHELGHAWLAHTGGRPLTEEKTCDLLGTFCVAVIRWLKISGGESALLRLQPGERLRPASARIMLSAGRPCGVCGKSVSPGLVECAPATDASGQISLRLYCDFCEHLQIWREMASVDGLPTAERVSDNRYDRGAEMRAFLVRHPECGVLYNE
jgi:hypothetical protein